MVDTFNIEPSLARNTKKNTKTKNNSDLSPFSFN